jgi:hypothetical protein
MASFDSDAFFTDAFSTDAFDFDAAAPPASTGQRSRSSIGVGLAFCLTILVKLMGLGS